MLCVLKYTNALSSSLETHTYTRTHTRTHARTKHFQHFMWNFRITHQLSLYLIPHVLLERLHRSYIGRRPFSPMYLRYIKFRTLDQILFTGCKRREDPSHRDPLERVSLDNAALSGGSTGQREISRTFFVQYIKLYHKRLEKYLQWIITYHRHIESHERILRGRCFAEKGTLKEMFISRDYTDSEDV
jgi:hypothetical protein